MCPPMAATLACSASSPPTPFAARTEKTMKPTMAMTNWTRSVTTTPQKPLATE